jgi:pantetheine-phosphate adenylyltransferase
VPDSLDPRHAVYVGSFDPPTLGHLDVIRRGARIFDRLTVGIGINPDKQPLFTPEERQTLVGELLRDLPNVEVASFEGLAVKFARERGARVMLRGFRMLTDMESEFTMSLANRRLAPDVESVFLVSSEQFSHISSSLIKQIAQLGDSLGGERLHEFVPEAVIAPLLAKFAG